MRLESTRRILTQTSPRRSPGYGGLRPPWGQSLLRSCLAAHSFPPPPPAEDALRAFAALGPPLLPTRSAAYQPRTIASQRSPTREVSCSTVAKHLRWFGTQRFAIGKVHGGRSPIIQGVGAGRS